MNEFKSLTLARDESLAIITLNRPEARNALNHSLRQELARALQQANDNSDIRVILLRANGEGFCAGADLTERLPGSDEDGFVTHMLRTEYNPIIKAIVEADKPVISVVQGAAAGIGASIAMACDLMIMAEDAFLYSAFGAISLIPDGGFHKFLQDRIGAKKAYEMIAFSQRLSAQQCLQLGLSNRLSASQNLDRDAIQWAQTLAQQAPLTLRLSKHMLQTIADKDLDFCLEQEALLQNTAIRSEDFAEGALAFFEKRQPRFKGH